jgi:hypothetical protein
MTFSLRSLSLATLSNPGKNMPDLLCIVMYNNIAMDPLTLFHVKLKRKEDIIHNVSIEC